MLTDLIQQSEEYKSIKSSIASGALSHAYMLIGQDTETRLLYTKLIAIACLCKSNSCFICPTCQKILGDCHLDIKYYNKDGKMKVKDAEELIEDTYIRGWESSRKLYFIENANTLSPLVQNKLLKVYEEPPAGVSIFMLCNSELGVLQTINSRAEKLYIPIFTSEQVFEELVSDGVDRKLAETASVFSGGMFDLARKFIDNKQFAEIYDMAFEILLHCKKSSQIVNYLNSPAFSKENINTTLDFFEIILRDVLSIIVSGSKAKLTTINRDYDLKAIADGYSAGGLSMSILVLAESRRMLLSYVSATSVAEKTLFNILEAKYKWQ